MHVIINIYELKDGLPIALAVSVLLGLGTVSVGVAALGEVARQMLFRFGSSVGEALMIAVVVLVGAGH